MNRIIFAITLSLSTSAALADGFAPWNGHTAVVDSTAMGAAQVPASGFAPWRDRAPILDSIDAAAMLSTHDGSIFRPWNIAS